MRLPINFEDSFTLSVPTILIFHMCMSRKKASCFIRSIAIDIVAFGV